MTLDPLSAEVDLERVFQLSRPLRRTPLVLRYALATLIVLAFFGLRSVTAPVLGGYPFLLFFPAIILIAVVLDHGTGVYAVLLSAALARFFFLPPVHSFALPSMAAAAPLALYVLVGLFLTLSIEALRATADRLSKTTDALERSDALNRLLLADVNHRVKNHLASVAALLRLSFKDIDDPAARGAMESATARVNVLGRLYNALHLDGAVTTVSARDFVCSLCEDLRRAVLGARPVTLHASAVEAPLEAEQAVPLGLVINELVENALKYAFPGGRPGEVWVSLDLTGGQFVLTVRDDGVGFDPERSRVGGGSRLVRAFARQLGGRFQYGDGPGATVSLSFPPLDGSRT